MCEAATLRGRVKVPFDEAVQVWAAIEVSLNATLTSGSLSLFASYINTSLDTTDKLCISYLGRQWRRIKFSLDEILSY